MQHVGHTKVRISKATCETESAVAFFTENCSFIYCIILTFNLYFINMCDLEKFRKQSYIAIVLLNSNSTMVL